jgi:hypothetical protein
MSSAMEPGTQDVQAELQDYLNSKNINTLFIQIVESLLIGTQQQQPDCHQLDRESVVFTMNTR